MTPRKPKARRSTAVPRGRQPVAQQPPSRAGDRLVYSFEHVDHSHDGSWRPLLDDPQVCHKVMRLLCEMSRLTWLEILAQQTGKAGRRKPKHHAQPVASLCNEAQDRIRELHLDEIFDDEIFRFRDGGEGRLWGFRRDGVFYILWWDDDHKVCPVEKRNT